MTDLSAASITWRGTTLYGSRGAGRRFTFETLEGWEARTSRRDSYPRPGAHGGMGSAPLADGRAVRVSGLCRTPAERDAMLAELDALFAFTDAAGPAEDLSVTLGGRTLTAPVWVSRYEAPLDLWGAGMFRWRVEFQSDDHLRFGPAVSAQTTFPELVGGLEYPLYTDGAGTVTGWLDYGSGSTSGRLSLANAGTAAASVQHEVTGPVDAAGFEIVCVETGDRLVFEGALASGARLLLDGGTGLVLVDGAYDRGDLLTWREWSSVPASGSREFAFIARGSDLGAVLRSTLRPAYW